MDRLLYYWNSLSWGTVFWGNTLGDYVIAVGMALLIFAVLFFGRVYIVRLTKGFVQRTKTHLDDMMIRILESIPTFLLFFLSLYIASFLLLLSVQVHVILHHILVIWLTVQGILWGQIIVNYTIKRQAALPGVQNRTALSLGGTLLKLLLWIIGAVLILSNLGINVTTLVTGLGIGGIAVALAVQNILGDLFGYFSIHFDQPFKEGELVEITANGGLMIGTIEKIGIKTTRIRSLRGEQVVVPNAQLTNGTISNFRKLQERRIVFVVAVPYETPAEKLQKIIDIIKKIVDATPQVVLDRCHLARLGVTGFEFETVYRVQVPEYVAYMEKNNAILFALKEAFDREGIAFAYPVQRVVLDAKN